MLLAVLESDGEKRRLALGISFENESFGSIQKVLLNRSGESLATHLFLNDIEELKYDPLLYQVSCLALGGEEEDCFNSNTSKSMAYRLMFGQGIPVI